MLTTIERTKLEWTMKFFCEHKISHVGYTGYDLVKIYDAFHPEA